METPLWGLISRTLPVGLARAIVKPFDRGVRVRVGGWKYAPVRRALRSVRWWWRGAWMSAFDGFIYFGTEEEVCDICARRNPHAHEGSLKGHRLRGEL